MTVWQKIICSQRDIPLSRSSNNRADMLDWYKTSGPTLGFWVHPPINTGYVNTTDLRDIVNADFGDDALCGVKVFFCHSHTIRDYRELCQANFANFAIVYFAHFAKIAP
ncbi:hypothetical protein [Brucella anthropi]|uniref:hypothetical protein n=1 Tax=Brucella anthropi TaxID=529 RepID=UPI0018656EBA|nr:hypothetical protein [Brucella anthropi]